MAITVKLKELRSSPTIKKTFTGVLIFLLVFSITGFFVVPPILRSALTKKLSEELHRQVSIRQVKVNPFVLSVTVKGFLIKERNGRDAFVSFDELYLNLQSISVLRRGLIFSEFKVDKPYVSIVRNEDGYYNFSDLLESKPKKETKNPGFSLNNIQILNGSIDFLDGPKHTAHKLRDMNIKIPFISNLPYYADIYVQPSFEAKVNDTPVSFKGKSKPFRDSLETRLDINIKDLDIPYYMAYSPYKMPFKVPSGFLDANTEVLYIQYRDRPPSLNVSGDVAFRKINVVDLEEIPLISLPALEISFAPSDLIAKRIHLSKVMLQSPELNISRDRSAKINLRVFLPEKQSEKTSDKEVSPFSLEADQIQVAAGKIEFSDFFKSLPFKTTIEMIEVKITNLSTSPDKKAKAHLSFQTESKESVKLESDFSTNPLVSEGMIELGQIQLKKYSPYYYHSVLFDIEEGGLDLSTKYKFKKTENELEAGLSELSAALTSLRLRKQGEKDDFLNIPTVSLNNTFVDLARREVIVGLLSTRNGLIKIRRSGDGKLNIQDLVPQSGASAGKPVKTKKGQDLLVTLKDVAADRYTVKIADSVPQEPVNLIIERINFKGTNLSTVKKSRGRTQYCSA